MLANKEKVISLMYVLQTNFRSNAKSKAFYWSKL